MYYLESDSRDPYWNLALEEYVFEALAKECEFFMLWQNDNTIVVGKYQNTIEEISQSFVDENQIKVVRRLSGGGAVYHDRGNLNYTFIVGESETQGQEFQRFTRYVIDALDQFGIQAKFTGRNDITIDGKKICGTAQYVKKGRVMHHGCILVDSNAKKVAGALKPKAMKFESKSTKSVRSRITAINACAAERITVDLFKDALKQQIFQDGHIEEYRLTAHDKEQVKKLRDGRYATWDWNYGKSPAYSFKAEHKFDFGLLCISAEIKEGVIKAAYVSGDFFGDGEIVGLEQALVGARVDGNLTRWIQERVDVSHYVKGATAEIISGLLQGKFA